MSPGEPSASRLAPWILLWALAVAAGYGLLFEYSVTPGEAARPPERWPASIALRPPQGRPRLVMVVHPHCACTRASLAELDRLWTSLAGRVEASVLFVQPEGEDAAWPRTALWEAAARLGDVELRVDAAGRLAEALGVRTSGHVLLYGAGGGLLFSGGITPTRGHQGDSVGRRRLVSLVETGRADRAESAVYGCPVFARGHDLTGRSWLERFEFRARPVEPGGEWCGVRPGATR